MLSKLVMIPFFVQLLCERAAFVSLDIDLKREEEEEEQEQRKEEEEGGGGSRSRRAASRRATAAQRPLRRARLLQKNGSG